MENTKIDYKKRLEELEEEQSRISREINEVRAAIRFEKVGNLETHYAGILPGMAICTHKSWADGDSRYMLIDSVKVELDYKMDRQLILYGVSLDIQLNSISYKPDHITIDLDSDGRMICVLFDGDPEKEDECYNYRILKQDELFKPNGAIKKQIKDCLIKRIDAYTIVGEKTVKQFLAQCRKSRKEIRERIAAQEASNEPGTVELA